MLFRNLLFLLIFLSSLSPTTSYSQTSNSLQFHSRQFNVIADHHGVPQLEIGEHAAKDPENVSDSDTHPEISSEPITSSDPRPWENSLEASVPPFDREKDLSTEDKPEIAVILDPITHSDGPQPNSQDILELDEEGAMESPEAITLDIVATSASPPRPSESPSASVVPSPSTQVVSITVPTPTTAQVTVAPVSSKGPSVVVVGTADGGVIATPSPSISASVSSTTLPSPSTSLSTLPSASPSTSVSEIPSPSYTSTSSPVLETPRSSPSLLETLRPSYSASPTVSESPIPSYSATSSPVMETPMSSVSNSPAVSDTPVPSYSTSPRVSETPVPSYSTSSRVSETPVPSYSTSPKVSETSMPSYTSSPSLSAKPSPSFSSSVSPALKTPKPSRRASPKESETPMPSNSVSPSMSMSPLPSYSLSPSSDVSGSSPSNAMETAAPPSREINASPSMSLSISPSTLPSSSVSPVVLTEDRPDGLQDTVIVLFPPSATTTAEVTVALPTPPTPPPTLLPSASASPSEVTGVLPMPSPTPPTEASPSTSPVPTTTSNLTNGNVVAVLPPSVDSFSCIYFGAGLIPEFTSPEPSFFSGEIAQFSVPQKNFPGLSPQYLSHMYGKSWSYSVPVEENVSYDFVLAFAEVFDRACDAGPDSKYREFSVSMQDQSITIDILKEVGCGKPLKKVFNNVMASGSSVEVSFQATAQNAILSTLCYRPLTEATTVPVPSPTPSPLTVSTPPVIIPVVSPSNPAPSAVTSAVPQPTSSPTITPTSVPQSNIPVPTPEESRTCFKFGDEVVEGYFNVQMPSPDSGVTFFNNPFAVVEGTSFNSVYSSHIFGMEFTVTINTQTLAVKSVELGFAEVFEAACEDNFRVFKVEVGSTSRTVDIFNEVGCSTALNLRFDGVVPSTSGAVNIVFSSIKNNAMVSTFCIIESDASINTASGKSPSGDTLEDEHGNPIVVVSGGRPESSSLASPSPGNPSGPLANPSPTLFPKENGLIVVSLPSKAPQETTEAILVGPGLPSEDHGQGSSSPDNTPFPTAVLVPANITSETTGGNKTPTPAPSPGPVEPTATHTPVSNLITVEAPGAMGTENTELVPSPTPSLDIGSGPTQTPAVSFSTRPSPIVILPAEEEPNASTEVEIAEVLASNDGESPPPIAILPAEEESDVSIEVEVGPGLSSDDGDNASVITILPDEEEPDVSTEVEVSEGLTSGDGDALGPGKQLTGEEESVTLQPSVTPGVVVAVLPPGSAVSTDASPSIAPSESSVVISMSPIPSVLSDSSSPFPAPETDSENQPGNEIEPDGEPPVTTPGAVPTAVLPVQVTGPGESNSTSSEGVTIGIDGATTTVKASPTDSTAAVPSPLNSGQPGAILPPVQEPLPSPSATPSVITPVFTVTPTLTPTPLVSTPVASPSVSFNEGGPMQGGVGASPNPTDDSPVVVPPGDSESEAASSSSDNDEVTTDEIPVPSPSQVSSSTGANEVITIATNTPVPFPSEATSDPDVAPGKPVSNVPDNSTAAIGVPDGTEVGDEGGNISSDGNDEEGPTIIAGPFMDVIGTKPEGNGFAIGMGILGSLLVLLLLTCLFFAIFRGSGGSYSYSSQYSAHKPADYDPSQGGYTDDLGLGTAVDGNDSLYGGGAGTGYTGGGGTLDSRPQNGSFTYEGAAEGLGGTIGSGYDLEPRDGEADPIGGSGYGNVESDAFPEYTNINQHSSQRPSGIISQSGNSGDFTFNETFAMPNTAAYPSGVHDDDRGEYQTPGETTTESRSRPGFGAPHSFNAYHSIARPMAHESESSGKQERTMESVAYGTGLLEKTSDNRNSESGHAQEVLSMSSAPSAAQSPYEQHMHVGVAHDITGNVSKRNAFILQTPSVQILSADGGATKSLDRVDTEPCDNNFLCNANAGTGTETGFVSRTADDTFPQRIGGGYESSNDEPWPSWWSKGKQNLVPVGTYTKEEQTMHITPTAADDSHWEQAKENETGSSYEAKRSVFETLPGGTCDILKTTKQRIALPLGPSSKVNLVVEEPSQCVDSGSNLLSRTQCVDSGSNLLSRMSGKSDAADADFEELRKRRQPYVKSVATRLSFGPQSFSTSITREAGIDLARKEYEREQIKANADMGRTSSSWISNGRVEVG